MKISKILPAAALASILLLGSAAHAQTTTGTAGDTTGTTGTTVMTGTTGTTPTTPDTGAGGEAPYNVAVLIGTALVAVLGVAYLATPQRS